MYTSSLYSKHSPLRPQKYPTCNMSKPACFELVTTTELKPLPLELSVNAEFVHTTTLMEDPGPILRSLFGIPKPKPKPTSCPFENTFPLEFLESLGMDIMSPNLHEDADAKSLKCVMCCKKCRNYFAHARCHGHNALIRNWSVNFTCVEVKPNGKLCNRIGQAMCSC